VPARRRARGEGGISKRKGGRWLGIAELDWQNGKGRGSRSMAELEQRLPRNSPTSTANSEPASSLKTSA
jgi:hypothetical protein